MSAYRVARDYRAVYRSQSVGFSEGDNVDVDDDVAAWVNRDSPGCLIASGKTAPSVKAEPAEEASEPAKKPVKRAAKKRA